MAIDISLLNSNINANDLILGYGKSKTKWWLDVV